MLSASLPPLRYRTTRLRVCDPCARARSHRNSGAEKVTVNAATPPLTNWRLVISTLIPNPQSAIRNPQSNELILRRSGDEMYEPRCLRLNLRVVPRPCTGRLQICQQLGHHVRIAPARHELGAVVR